MRLLLVCAVIFCCLIYASIAQNKKNKRDNFESGNERRYQKEGRNDNYKKENVQETYKTEKCGGHCTKKYIRKSGFDENGDYNQVREEKYTKYTKKYNVDDLASPETENSNKLYKSKRSIKHEYNNEATDSKRKLKKTTTREETVYNKAEHGRNSKQEKIRVNNDPVDKSSKLKSSKKSEPKAKTCNFADEDLEFIVSKQKAKRTNEKQLPVEEEIDEDVDIASEAENSDYINEEEQTQETCGKSSGKKGFRGNAQLNEPEEIDDGNEALCGNVYKKKTKSNIKLAHEKYTRDSRGADDILRNTLRMERRRCWCEIDSEDDFTDLDKNGDATEELTASELRETNAQLTDQNTLLKAQLAACAPGPLVSEPLPRSLPTTDDLAEQVKGLEAENAEKTDELERLRKDQDDLLELLTDQDTKLNSFKQRLRALGETIDDADSDNNSGESENES